VPGRIVTTGQPSRHGRSGGPAAYDNEGVIRYAECGQHGFVHHDDRDLEEEVRARVCDDAESDHAGLVNRFRHAAIVATRTSAVAGVRRSHAARQ